MYDHYDCEYYYYYYYYGTFYYRWYDVIIGYGYYAV